MGVLAVAAGVFLGLALWLIVKDTTEKKIAVELAFLIVVALPGIVFMPVAAACMVAKVQDGRLEFFFCGIRRRSFSLDGDTTFELPKIGGRLEVLTIRRGRSTYVPSGLFDKESLVDLLRANGVAERTNH
jgi:hypothetical protein